jgi:hypothetical protein
VEVLLDRRKTLKSRRQTWEQTWQELAEVLMPRRADFLLQHWMPGERRTDRVFDSIPMQARRMLAAGIDGLIKPKNAQWFHLRSDDPDLAADHASLSWLEDTERRMFSAIYAPQARFVQRTGEVDNDLVAFGTGVLFIGENAEMNHLVFRSFHLRDVLIAENSDGAVDTVFINMERSARQAAQQWGEENLSEDIRRCLREDKPDEIFDFVWVVTPRPDYDSSRRNSQNLPWASIVIEVKSEKKVRESGFHEFPFAIPRWDTTSGETYGRGPGHVALPDAETLQAMGKTILVAGQRAVDPPMWMTNDGAMSAVRSFPGGLTYIDGEAMRQLGRVPVGELTSNANIPLGREMQNDIREQVWGAFFRNVLQLPVDSPRMTATEVMERKEEFLRAIGPVFGQLESDYIARIVERVYGIMARAGAFSDPPEQLAGSDIRFEFESPVMRARHQIEAVGLSRSLEIMGPLIQADPTMLDHYDRDAIARDAPKFGGFPQRWLKPPEVVQEERGARAQAEQAQTALAGGQQMADIAAKVGPLLQEGQNAEAPA